MGAYAVKKIPSTHPRLFGTKADLLRLRAARGGAYNRMKGVARGRGGGELDVVMSNCLVYAIEGGEEYARRAIGLARRIMSRPLKRGHETFAHEMAKVAIVWDHCFGALAEDDRKRIIEWVDKEYEINIDVESHVFFNGYYGYKMWGFGLAGYATYPENPRAREMLDWTTKDVVERAVPAQKYAGDGGGWPEGYYVHYFLYDWLLYCEAARRLEGIDYYEMAREFYAQRAICEMFECYPGRFEYNSRKMPCWGDGGGKVYGGDRDMAMCVRRILARYFLPEDQTMRYVVAFNRETPEVGGRTSAYMDFLFGDPDLPTAPLCEMKLAHLARGAGHVYARSSWKDDATWVFFKASKRFTGHQHLDAGHFEIWKHDVLAADSGEYASFHDAHTINYYMRTIAHNCILVHDPGETWRGTRSGMDGANDGGQAYPWTGTPMAPNGSARDMRVVESCRQLVDIADIVAYEDTPLYTYAVGDCTRAYSPGKMIRYVRHFLFLRPDSVIVFDYVVSKNAGFRKTWLLHTVNEPSAPAGEEKKEEGFFACAGDMVTAVNGRGRITCQTVLPREHTITKIGGKGVRDYWYGGKQYPVSPGPHSVGAAHWRIEVSPKKPATADAFLHVIWVGEKSVPLPPPATVLSEGGMLGAEFATPGGRARVFFDASGRPGGQIDFFSRDGRSVSQPLATDVALASKPLKPPKPKAASASLVPKRPKAKGKAPEGPTDEQRKKAEEVGLDLRERITEGVEAGRTATTYVRAMGMRVRGRITAADDEGVTVDAKGMTVKLKWQKMTPKEFYAIARKLVDDHAALHDYCLGMGLEEQAEAEKAAGR